ncbi:MAG: hypothetical protein HC897_18840 [Thermoanaerobaculia bacterium]|nr:hypothetical protein [Thermoanaerobaculia bacterium]
MSTVTSTNGSPLAADLKLDQQLLEALEVVGPEPTRFDRVLEVVRKRHDRTDEMAIREAFWRLLYQGVIELTPDRKLRTAAA